MGNDRSPEIQQVQSLDKVVIVFFFCFKIYSRAANSTVKSQIQLKLNSSKMLLLSLLLPRMKKI